MKTRVVERPSLEVTFRKGRAFAAYLHLPRAAGLARRKTARSSERAHGLIVDFTAEGEARGVEITAPSLVDVDELNAILRELHVEELEPKDLAPLRAARA
jgi:hypothetical protein